MNRYVLYLPFEFPSEGAIKEPLPYNGALIGYPVTIIHNSPYYALLVENIESEKSAKILFGRLFRVLHLMAIELSTAIRIDKKIQLTEYVDSPTIAAKNMNEQGFSAGETLDALIDGAQPAIYLQGKIVRRLTGQRASFGLGYSPENILNICDRSLSASFQSDPLNGRKALAAEIYAYAKFETSGPARFVMLCYVRCWRY